MKPSFLALDTIVAPATPPGEGAIGIVRLSGPDALALAASRLTLSCGGGLAQAAPRKALLSVFHDRGRSIDQVVVTFYRSPRSFTG